MPKPRKRSWLAQLEEELKALYGPAEVRDPGKPRQRSANRLEGVGGDYEMHRGPDGRAYLVARPRGGHAAEPGTGVAQGEASPEGEPGRR
jgi:hypothetical protein